MTSLRDLYIHGQFTLLKERLEQQLSSSESCQTQSLARQLALQNNLGVCTQLTEQNTSQASKFNKTAQDAFAKILINCSSADPTEDLLSVEVTSLYNWIYCHILNKGNNSTWSADNFQAVEATLSRVLTYLCGDVQTDCTQSSDPTVTWNLLLENIWTILSIRDVSNSLTLALCQCTWILLVTSLRSGRISNMSPCLSTLLEVLSIKQISQVVTSELLMTIPLQLDQRELSPLSADSPAILLRDVTIYLQAVCHCRSGKWSENVLIMEKVSDSVCKVTVTFLTGYSEYRRGKYLEALSILMEVVRSSVTMTTHLKARIYNLMGNCFSKMDKFRLSTQMYQQALNSDFSYLLPLYNSAEQYRKQQSTYMELELLNLLVKALEMRAPPSSVATPAVDLLHLVDTQDTDISYIHGLYILASRSLQYHKYDVAAETYVTLLNHLKSWNLDAEETTKLPSMLQVHHEAMLSMLNSGHYTECIKLCDSVLLSYHGNTSHDLSHDLSCDVNSQGETSFSTQFILTCDKKTFDKDKGVTPMTTNVCESSQKISESQRKKRKYSEVSEEGNSTRQDVTRSEGTIYSGSYSNQTEINNCPVYDVDVLALKYKAESLVKTGDCNAAVTCLKSAVDSVCRLKRRHLSSLDTSASPSRHGNKRQKLDAHCVPERGQVQFSAWGTQVLQMELDLYTKLTELTKRSEPDSRSAVHYKRLAVQVKTALQHDQ